MSLNGRRPFQVFQFFNFAIFPNFAIFLSIVSIIKCFNFFNFFNFPFNFSNFSIRKCFNFSIFRFGRRRKCLVGNVFKCTRKDGPSVLWNEFSDGSAASSTSTTQMRISRWSADMAPLNGRNRYTIDRLIQTAIEGMICIRNYLRVAPLTSRPSHPGCSCGRFNYGVRNN